MFYIHVERNNNSGSFWLSDKEKIDWQYDMVILIKFFHWKRFEVILTYNSRFLLFCPIKWFNKSKLYSFSQVAMNNNPDHVIFICVFWFVNNEKKCKNVEKNDWFIYSVPHNN